MKKNLTRMNMKRKRIFKFLPLLLFAAGAMFVASCSSDDDEVNPLLLNEWVLVSYGNEPNEVLKEAKGYFYSNCAGQGLPTKAAK